MIPVLVGPTASGKTAIAHAVARLADIDIIAADSRTVYLGLDVGTAKPSPADRAAYIYHGLDLVEPTERYAAGKFARDAAGWLQAALAAGRLPLVVGGTGFYLRALFEGLFEEPPLDDERRERLQAVLRRMPPEERLRWVRRLDEGYTGGRNTQRSSRALEVALLAGHSLSALQRAAPTPGARPAQYFRIEIPRGLLHERIARRAAEMLRAGLVDEVRGALARGVPHDAPGLTGVGYREVVQHLEGRLPAAGLEEAITQATRQYAKRQETWFRHQLPDGTMVLDGTQPPDVLAAELLSGYRAATCG